MRQSLYAAAALVCTAAPAQAIDYEHPPAIAYGPVTIYASYPAGKHIRINVECGITVTEDGVSHNDSFDAIEIRKDMELVIRQENLGTLAASMTPIPKSPRFLFKSATSTHYNDDGTNSTIPASFDKRVCAVDNRNVPLSCDPLTTAPDDLTVDGGALLETIEDLKAGCKEMVNTHKDEIRAQTNISANKFWTRNRNAELALKRARLSSTLKADAREP